MLYLGSPLLVLGCLDTAAIVDFVTFFMLLVDYQFVEIACLTENARSFGANCRVVHRRIAFSGLFTKTRESWLLVQLALIDL